MEKQVAKDMAKARRAYLDSVEARCARQDCGQPKKWHSAWAHSRVRVTDHKFVKREDGDE